MGQAGNALALPNVDSQGLHLFQQHFVAPEIFQRNDFAVRQLDLARFVSDEIIPRLLRLHTDILPDLPVEPLIEALAPSGADISALASIVLGDDLEAAATYVTVLRDRGLSMETLYTELLEPTARHLGKLWDDDRCDFVDVTVGVARLQQLLSIFNDTHRLPQIGARRQVLMTTAPGNQHSFGASMIEKLLSAAGWQVETEYSGSGDAIVDCVRRSWFAVIGLTAGSDEQLEALKAIIIEVRRHSKNQSIGVMVGGPMFTENPTLALAMGADSTAPNAPTAVLAAQKLFEASLPSSQIF